MTIRRAGWKNAAGKCKNLTSGKKEANACLTSDRGEADCRVSGKAARRRRGDPALQKRLVNGEKVGPHRHANGDTGQEGAIPRIDCFPRQGQVCLSRFFYHWSRADGRRICSYSK